MDPLTQDQEMLPVDGVPVSDPQPALYEQSIDAGTPQPTASEMSYTLTSAVGFFNVVAGLMLVAAFLTFFGGLSAYLSRLGLHNRVEGLMLMHWGVTILFVLIILLAVVKLLISNPILLYGLASFIVVCVIVWFVFAALTAGDGEEDH